jgi:hypothetical protein
MPIDSPRSIVAELLDYAPDEAALRKEIASRRSASPVHQRRDFPRIPYRQRRIGLALATACAVGAAGVSMWAYGLGPTQPQRQVVSAPNVERPRALGQNGWAPRIQPSAQRRRIAPVGHDPFRQGHRVTLKEAQRRLGGVLVVPSQPLAERRLLSAIWSVPGAVAFDYISTVVRVFVFHHDRRMTGLASLERSVETGSEGGGLGVAQAQRGRFVIVVTGPYHRSELEAVARSVRRVR